MPGLGKHPTAAGVAALGKAEPVSALLAEPICTEAAEEHIVRAFVLGVQLESIALKALDRECLAVDRRLFEWSDGEAKDRKTTVLFPEFGDSAVHALIRFDEAALGGGGWCGGRHDHRADNDYPHQYEECKPIQVFLFSNHSGDSCFTSRPNVGQRSGVVRRSNTIGVTA
jgi:hypothetical protein